MRAINNVEELRESLARGNTEFAVRVNRSAIPKTIFSRTDGSFSVFDGIDGFGESLSAEELRSESFIGRAMEAGAFFEDG